MTFAQLPILLTSLVLAIYWARVARMALKARKQTGQAANFLPPEPLGRALRILWIPAVTLWIIAPVLACLVPSRLTAPAPAPLAVTWIAAAVTALCLAASWICWRRMGRSWRMGINPDEKTQLVVTGPYAYVRHPIYAISTLMAIASALAVPSFAMITAVAVHVMLLQWESRREEEHLLRTHGESYRTYCTTVGRFVPRLRYGPGAQPSR